jgi:superfamily II DNA or RNA helicase
MIRLTQEDIKKSATNTSTYARGVQYYKSGLVQSLVNDMGKRTIQTRVSGSRIYSVEVRYDEKGAINKKSCTCPAFDQYWGDCKHITAVLLKAVELFGHLSGAVEDRYTGVPVAAIKTPPEEQAEKKIIAGRLVVSDRSLTKADPNIHITHELLSGLLKTSEQKNIQKEPVRMKFTVYLLITGFFNSAEVELDIGKDRLYSVKDLREFFDCIYAKREIYFGKTFTYNPSMHSFNTQDNAVVEYLIDAYHQQGTNVFTGHSVNKRRRLNIAQGRLRRFFELAAGLQDVMLVSGYGEEEGKMSVVQDKPRLGLDIEYKGRNPELVLNKPSEIYVLGRNQDIFLSDNTVYIPGKEDADNIRNVLTAFAKVKSGRLPLPEEEIPVLISSAAPLLERTFHLRISKELQKRIYREPLAAKVWLDKLDEGISSKLSFHYGKVEIYPLADNKPTDFQPSGTTAENILLVRDTQRENEILDMLSGMGFVRRDAVLALQNEEYIYDFLAEGMTKLAALAEIYYSDAFGRLKIRSSPKIHGAVKLDEDSDLLEITFDIEGFSADEIMDFMKAMREKRKFFRLKDGSFLSMEDSEAEAAARLLSQLAASGIPDLSHHLSSSSPLRLPKHRALYLDQIVREYGREHFNLNSPFKQMVKNIREPQELDFELPGSLDTVLRDYQKTGFKWLKALSYYGLGGILADDMGLGKTLQAITLVQSDYSLLQQPSLVIAPTSLVYNWQDEINKFAPQLSVLVFSGSKQEREELLKEVHRYAFVITSYALIRRDIEEMREISFSFCFLDEAQNIKNPDTINAKSVKQLNARRFFAMTGTPVENSLTELWSIFDFIMPGYLYSHREFQSRFETPVVKNNDMSALGELGRHIRPFILRRMKKDVLTELPDKIETKSLCEMTENQKKVYLNYLSRARKAFEDEISNNGFEKSRIKILALLTRLRQICCHPSVFLENYSGGSGKLDALAEIIEDALGAGHRILLFSQFTSMLAIIRARLEELGHVCLYIDGKTEPEERLQLVKAFNGGEGEVFLISLKAGGTGLNLTGADTVIHYDPWWNPAVEDQATDRAYRMGQKRSVQVFKLISRGTIEEKIYLMQEKKKELINSVIQPGENFLGKLSLQDIRGLFEA